MNPSTQQSARDYLAIPLDTDDLVVALRLARQVRQHVAVAKVGLELFSAVGPDAITALQELDLKVFCDLKLHDIPTTVGRTARVLASTGAQYINAHITGGSAMMSAFVEGLAEGADAAGVPMPVALGVTVLTSDATATAETLASRAEIARQAGCGGVVCAVADITTIRSVAPELVCVTPGIRPLGSGSDDQQRVATPAEAIAAGSDLLVIGRPITGAKDPARAAEQIAEEVEAALAGRRVP